MNWLNRMNTNTSSPIAVPDGKHDDVTVLASEPVGNTEVAHGEYPTNDGTGAIYAPNPIVIVPPVNALDVTPMGDGKAIGEPYQWASTTQPGALPSASSRRSTLP